MGIEVGPGSLAGALGLLGVGIAMIVPDNKWIGGIFILAAVAIMFFDIRFTGWQLSGHAPSGSSIALWGMIVFGLGFIFCAGWYFWPSSNSPLVDPLTGAVFIEVKNMQPLPVSAPADRELEVFFATPEAMQNGVTTGGNPKHFPPAVPIQSFAPGSKIDWPKSASSSPFSKVAPVFDIINDTDGPLLDLIIPIQASYGSPPLTKVLENNIVITRLEAGAEKRRSIVIFNKSPDGGAISFGNLGQAHRPGRIPKAR